MGKSHFFDGNSPLISEVNRILVACSTSKLPVLLTGEHGVGKTFAAQLIHHSHPNRTGPIISVECSQLVPGFAEKQLFGYAKGAFPGATTDHLGLIRSAENGTIILEEVASIPLDSQTRLLQWLQNRAIRPIGSPIFISTNVRVLATSSRDLMIEVEQGRFRKDLFFRLNVLQVPIPALRNRKEDIPVLIQELQTTNTAAQLNESDHRKFGHHNWPGNVRELQEVIERCDAIGVKAALASFGDIDVMPLVVMKDNAIEAALQFTNGNVAQTAEILDIGTTTVYRWLERNPTRKPNHLT
jgi:DNA-binding NtrC family response regulator